MNKLKTTLLALMFGVVTTPLVAGSSDHAGPFIAVQGQSAGVALNGSYIDSDLETTEGTGGKLVQIGSASDFETYYIAPSIAVSESSALYIKLGSSTADVAATGDFTGTSSKELDGDLYAFGSTTMFPSGIFVKAEAGIIEYDNIFVNDIGTADENGTVKGDVNADPSMAYGGVTLGYKF